MRRWEPSNGCCLHKTTERAWRVADARGGQRAKIGRAHGICQTFQMEMRIGDQHVLRLGAILALLVSLAA